MQATSTPLRVIQSVAGTFHHFDLARELSRSGNLLRIYSTFHWGRLEREQVPRQLVRTFPLLHPAMMLMHRSGLEKWAMKPAYLNFVLFDKWVAARIEDCDTFVGLSGNAVETAQVAKRRGAKYVCDRGSSHIRYQDLILREEYRRWGIDETVCDPRMIEREEREYSLADAITVPSEFARRSFIESGVSAEKVHKIPYGVNLTRFRKTAEPASDTFEVLFVGGVGFRKGVPYLLDAFARFSHPKKQLRLIGQVQDQIKPYLEKAPLDRVEILGAVPQAELTGIMSRSHVLVLPSIEEGLALVQGQAMACGCPIISSTNTGGSDLFTPGVEGFEVPVRSPEAIVKRLEQLAGDPALRETMSHAALTRVRSLNGWSEYAQNCLSLYRRLQQN